MEKENTIILELGTTGKYIKSISFSGGLIEEGGYQRGKQFGRVSNILGNKRHIDFDLYFKIFNQYLSGKSKIYLLNCLLSGKVEKIRGDIKSELGYYGLLFNSSEGYILNPLLYSVGFEGSKGLGFYVQGMLEVMREKFLNKEKRDGKAFKPFNLILTKCMKNN